MFKFIYLMYGSFHTESEIILLLHQKFLFFNKNFQINRSHRLPIIRQELKIGNLVLVYRKNILKKIDRCNKIKNLKILS